MPYEMETRYAVRHGGDLANIIKESSFRHADHSLTAKGRLQAEQTAQYFVFPIASGVEINCLVSGTMRTPSRGAFDVIE